MNSRISAIGGLAAVLSSSSALGAPTQATAGTAVVVRYASPNGQASATCPSTEPCDIATAIASAPASSHVILLPGTYAVGATVADNNAGLLISGAVGRARPIIDSAAGGTGPIQINNGSRVTGLTINYTGTAQGLAVLNGSADHMVVNASSNAFSACLVDTTLTDSLCSNTAPKGAALVAVLDNGSPTYRNVTAIATGTGLGADGLSVNGDSGSINVTATNSIFKGPDDDVRFFPEDDGETESITLHSCDFATSFFNNVGVGISTEAINVDNTDIKSAPRFTLGTYQEAAGSPTINRGVAVPAGDTDLANHPRLLGSKTDMGAYEFEQTARASGLKFSKKKPASVTVMATINPEGLATKAHLVATHGLIAISSPTVSAGKGRAAKKLTFKLGLLSPKTKYSIRVVTVNAGGTATSAAKIYTTPRH
jgi:hypothetical protein